MTFVDKVEALRQEIIYPKSLARLITVQFDDHSVRVRTTARVGLDWNQRFAWSSITRACCVFGGSDSASILFLDLRDRAEPARVLLDSPGAEDFFSGLVDRGIFPIAVRPNRRPPATAQIGLHCPPPRDYHDALRSAATAHRTVGRETGGRLPVSKFHGGGRRYGDD